MGAVAAITIRQALRRAGMSLALPLAACSASHDDKARGDNVAVVVAATPAARPAAATARPTPLPTVTPVPTPTSFSDMHPHRDFTDPPLPPELRDSAARTAPPPPSNGASPTH